MVRSRFWLDRQIWSDPGQILVRSRSWLNPGQIWPDLAQILARSRPRPDLARSWPDPGQIQILARSVQIQIQILVRSWLHSYISVLQTHSGTGVVVVVVLVVVFVVVVVVVVVVEVVVILVVFPPIFHYSFWKGREHLSEDLTCKLRRESFDLLNIIRSEWFIMR